MVGRFLGQQVRRRLEVHPALPSLAAWSGGAVGVRGRQESTRPHRRGLVHAPPPRLLSGCCEPPFVASWAVGVFSNDEEAFPEVGCADFGSGNNPPREAIPHCGKLRGDSVEASPKMSGDVFQEHESGSKCANGVRNVRPEVSGVAGSKTFPCVGEGLARPTDSPRSRHRPRGYLWRHHHLSNQSW
jgi:hypothetical protein